MDARERRWIVSWSVLQGVSLLALHYWMKSLPDPAAQFAIVWPLYWLALTIPLSLQMLAHTRTNQLTWRMVAGFCLMMVGPVAYSGYAVGVGDAWRYGGDIVSAGLLMATCWFILLPFAEHRLTRQRWFSDYSLLFASAWRNTIKLLSATVFTGLFWLLLLLWAQLFGMLKIHVFSDLFRSPAFIYPVTAIAYGIGLSLYATKEEALVNVYQTSLTILGWLLPLIAFIMLLFLATLPIAGLNALWKTGSATALMLSMQGLMVFLFNAAWQDGPRQARFSPWLARFIQLGLLSMPVYSVLCAWSLGLRVHQYGWSTDRVWAALAGMMLAMYAIGYAITSLRRQQAWMAGAKQVNIGTALLMVAMLILTMTPVLNPARIVVNSQLDRLLSRKVSAEQFDFDYISNKTGRYGRVQAQALLANKALPEADIVHQRLRAALSATATPDNGVHLSAQAIAAKLIFYPASSRLDPAFPAYLQQQLQKNAYFSRCLRLSSPCHVLAIDLNNDGKEELVLFDQGSSRVFGKQEGHWQQVAELQGTSIMSSGEALAKLLASGAVSTVPHAWRDLRIGKGLFTVTSKTDRQP